MRSTNLLAKFFPYLSVFLLALFLRLYELPARFIFFADEEYQATYAATIVAHFHRIWIGVNAGATGFYLGPYWTYLTALLLKLSGGDPLLTGYAAAVIGALSAALVVYLGSRLFNLKVGFFAGMLYAFLPLIVYFDQRYWNPSASAFLALGICLALVQLKEHKFWLIVLAVLLGAILHVHLALIPLWFVSAYFVWRERRRFHWRDWAFAASALILMLFPLAVFDYYHQASNLLTPYRLLTSRTLPHLSSLLANASIFADTLGRLWWLRPGASNFDEIRPGCPTSLSTSASPALSILALVPLAIFLFRRSSWHSSRAVLSLSLVALALAFLFFPQPVTGYYALGLLPLYLLVIAALAEKYLYPVLAVVVFASCVTIFTTNPAYGYLAKKQLIAEVSNRLNRVPYTLVEAGTCHKYGGWRYLFKTFAYAPAQSSTDENLGWLYPKEISPQQAVYKVLVGATQEISAPAAYDARFSSGGYTAYLWH